MSHTTKNHTTENQHSDDIADRMGDRIEALEKAVQNLLGLFDTPLMRLTAKGVWTSMHDEAISLARDAMEVTVLPRDSLKVHGDWDFDGYEDGEDLWRLDLPDIQLQMFGTVYNRGGGETSRYTGFRLFVEHDVRDASGDRRVKYSGKTWTLSLNEAVRILALSVAEVPAHGWLRDVIAEVKAMPDDPAMR